MAGAEMKEIKNRIKSVEGIMQITKAMELVASSKLRKSKDLAENSRPFFNSFYNTMCDIARSSESLESIYAAHKKPVNTLFIVVAGDRGLAGGYNSNVLKLAMSEISKEKEKNKNIKILPIGTKAVEHFKKNGYELLGEFCNFAQNITIGLSNSLTNIVTESFCSGKVDEVFIVFTDFKSMLNQVPVSLKLLPIDTELIKDATNYDADSAKPNEIVYEPSPVEVFNSVVPRYLTGLLYCAVLDSFASEQGARRTAMEAASDNAGEMIDNLSLKYNRARQASITQEITEIIGGAQAAK